MGFTECAHMFVLSYRNQVVSKIIKHSREAHPSTALGVLIGIDLDGTLEVSNSFPLPQIN